MTQQTTQDEDEYAPPEEGSPIRNPFETTLAAVVSRIRSGELGIGERLPVERDLSEELGVSRNTMRAVIRALQQAGYVRTHRGRTGGSFVIWEGDEPEAHQLSEMMKARLRDTLMFRSVLEPGAAALAAREPLTEAERSELTARLERATSNGPGFRQADAELHGYVAQLSGCRALQDSIVDVQLILNDTLLQVVPVMGPALAHSHKQHAQIVDAILRGDTERARLIMFDHIDATAELIRGFLG